MKKWILCIGLLLCMAGCGQKEVQTGQENGITEEDLVLTYSGTEEFYKGNIAVGNNGMVYTAKYDWDVKALCISVYDSNGVCLEEKLLGASTGGISLLESGKGVLYLVVTEQSCNHVLYEIDTTTWQAKRLYDFYDFNMLYKIVQVGEEVYVFGTLENPPTKQYSQYSSEWPYTYSGTVLVKLSYEGEVPVLEEVDIDFPIDIFNISDEGLGVYCYTEENGFVVCEYKQGELQQKRQLMGAAYSDFRGCGEGFLYQKSLDRVCYGTMDDDTETDILVSSGGFSALWMTYKDGFFYSKDNKKEIQRVSMDSVLKKNKTLQFLGSAWVQEMIYQTAVATK